MMSEKEINEENYKIYLHNKFCFMKKKIPYYKPIVPLAHSIVLFMISASFLVLPSLLKVGSESGKNKVLVKQWMKNDRTTNKRR